MPYLTRAQARIYYSDTGGDKPALFFGHGLLWSGEMFAEQIASLQARYRCVAIDWRGQGQSEVCPSGYDMETLTEDAAALIHELGVAPCHYVGLSMGGFVGLRLALRHPQLLRSLVLLNSAADPEPLMNIPKYKAMGVLSRIVGIEPFLGTVKKIMFGRTFLADPERETLRNAMIARLAGNNLAGVRKATDGVIFRRGVIHRLSRITTPTLVVGADEDVAVSPRRAESTARAIPGARYVTIPRAGHSSTIEAPAAVTEAIETFIANLN